MSSNKNNVVNLSIAAVSGAIIGGLAVAGFFIFSDEEKRGKVKKRIADAREKVVAYVRSAKDLGGDDSSKKVNKNIFKKKRVVKGSSKK